MRHLMIQVQPKVEDPLRSSMFTKRTQNYISAVLLSIETGIVNQAKVLMIHPESSSDIVFGPMAKNMTI